MPTAAQRLGYIDGRKIQHLAEGGLISKLFGSKPTETVTEKYARQDAELAAKQAARAPKPAAPATEAAPAGGALNPANALAAREKAAGLAMGGEVKRRNMEKGGPVPGKSPHPRADNIPIMATAKEFMIQQPAVKKIDAVAPGLLEALNALGNDERPRLGRVRRRRGGGNRQFAVGGPILPADTGVPPSAPVAAPARPAGNKFDPVTQPYQHQLANAEAARAAEAQKNAPAPRTSRTTAMPAATPAVGAPAAAPPAPVAPALQMDSGFNLSKPTSSFITGPGINPLSTVTQGFGGNPDTTSPSVRDPMYGEAGHYAQGGLIEMYPGRNVAPYVNHRAPNGPPATPPPLALPNNAPPPGTAVSTRPGPNFTMGANTTTPSNITDVVPKTRPQLALPAPTPAAAPALPQVDMQRQAWQGKTGSPQAEAWQASRTGQAPSAPAPIAAPAAPAPRLGVIGRMAPRAGAALAAVPEVMDTADVAMNPKSTGIDVATQGAQGAARMASAGLGAAAGAGLGAMTGPLAPIAIPVGAVAGGAYGYYAGNKAIEAGRAAVGADSRAPVDRLPSFLTSQQVRSASTAVSPRPATEAGAGRASPRFDEARRVDMDPGRASLGQSRDFTRELGAVPKELPADLRQGVIHKTIGPNGNPVYSGVNVGANAQMVNGKGATIQPRGIVNSIDTSAGFAADKAALASGAGDSNPALFAARQAAVARGDVGSVKDSYGGNFGPKVDAAEALLNNGKPMTARKAAAYAQIMAARAHAEGATADRALNAAKFGVEKEGAELTNREKKGILTAQEALANAKTPAERVTAEANLRARQGKYEKEAPPVRMLVVPGGVDEAGNKLPGRVFDPDTRQYVGEDAPKPKFEAGKVYKDAQGNKAKWDGKAFVPA